jgi:hypothetical protein
MLDKTYFACLSATAALILANNLALAAPTNKCVVDGQVTYQQGPCPTGQARRQPTVEELNALEKQRRAVAAPSPSAAPNSGTPPSSTTNTPAPPAALTSFRCDGRQHCSQMTSCAEAKFFLANCPNTKMDGDHDGIPCEQQWCTGPLAK